MSIELVPHADGVILPVQAQPRARRNGVVGEHAGCLKVAVTQVPEKGKANDAILKVIAEALQIKKSQIELLTGETSTKKQYLIHGYSVLELAARCQAIAAAMPSSNPTLG